MRLYLENDYGYSDVTEPFNVSEHCSVESYMENAARIMSFGWGNPKVFLFVLFSFLRASTISELTDEILHTDTY